MSKGNSGLFHGTKGQSSKNKPPSHVYRTTQALKDHLEMDNGCTKTGGITGAHRKVSFETASQRYGIKVEGRQPNSQIKGVEKVSYRLPKKDLTGKPTGEYQAKLHSKTIYDSNVISTSDYMKSGIEAANNAAKHSSSGKLDRVWQGTDNKGRKWIGYCDSDDNISTFFPDD